MLTLNLSVYGSDLCVWCGRCCCCCCCAYTMLFTLLLLLRLLFLFSSLFDYCYESNSIQVVFIIIIFCIKFFIAIHLFDQFYYTNMCNSSLAAGNLVILCNFFFFFYSLNLLFSFYYYLESNNTIYQMCIICLACIIR